VIPVKPKRGILFRTGKELRDRVNRPEALARPLEPDDEDDGTENDNEGNEGGTPPVAAGA
jgi:integration host factor subunit beta